MSESDPKRVIDLGAMSDAQLADEHRGRSFALERAKAALKAVEAEMEARGLTEVRGTTSLTTRHTNQGLLDIKRIRAECGADFCRRYAAPGTEVFWRSRTLSAEERG